MFDQLWSTRLAMRICQYIFVSVLILVSGVAGAAETAPGAGTLTVVSPGGVREITLSEIEALGLRHVKTRSPWEAGELSFQGVLLRDFLRDVGLEEADAVIFIGEDGYAQTIPRVDWEDWPVILATRQDGEPLSRRTLGPARVVYPLDDHPELDRAEYTPRWVWTIKTIEAAN